MNKDIEFFIYNYCIDKKNIIKTRWTLKSLTHKWLSMPKKLFVGISLFLCSTNCMLLNTVHRGRWEYIAKSIIVIIIIIIIISVIVKVIIGSYSTCYDWDVITMFSDRSSDWSHTAKRLHRQYDSLWCMMVDVVRRSSCVHTSGVPVLDGLIAVFTKIIFKLGFFASP